ncbi:MAG TPA: BamA/TamA family outer membrane protein, partial [Longimicrobiaceae bacterium]|nr:BamA/TamA family outer membrane protein [Longimicrobiaceae bacterium]
LPICVPIINVGRETHQLDLDELARDIVRLQLYHRDHGFYNSQIAPSIDEVDEGVSVAFFIDPGRQVVLRDLVVAGADTILDPEETRRAIPLEAGEPFGRLDFLASADTIRQRLLQRGYAYADVLRNYSIDTIVGVAEAEYIALPGPIVFVDTVIVGGNERLTERTIRRQLAFREGDILRAVALNDSQRNLYGLDMVNIASIRLATDTIEADQARHGATVLVEVVEAAQYAVMASGGFGTVDCFRTSGQWVNRNFIGAGRRLELNGSLSRVGVGDPTDLGLGGSVCTPIGDAGFLDLPGFQTQDLIDYHLSANLRQPRVLGTANQVALNLHAERISEPDAYIRESMGGNVTAARELQRAPMVVTTTLDIERGRTEANPALLCVGFDTCTQADLDLLRQYRWSNSLSVASVFDRQRLETGPSSGYILRGSVDWASSVLLSDDNYLRVYTEGSYYHPLRPGWTLAANLRFGRFLQGVLGSAGGYIPPERRFYAGGPTSVRGYTRNALGPTTYISTTEDADDILQSATGGTQLIVSSLELRAPSPWLSDVLRLAAFVDAGNVSAPGSELFDRRGLRFTPGVGVRLQTPVGPFRFDLAYNPYAGEPGPLYIADPGAGLILDDPQFQPGPPDSFLGRFRIQFAIGQAF